MAGLCFGDVAARPTELLDLTSLTREEFAAVVGPFEAAFAAHMTLWRFDGQPRRARRYTTYTNCPLPTAEDRLFFLLVYLKTYPAAGGARAALRTAAGQDEPMDPRALAGPTGGAAAARRRPQPLPGGVGAASGRAGGGPGPRAGGGADGRDTRGTAGTAGTAGDTPPFCHDGTERRIPRPGAADAQTRYYSGKKTCHTVKNVLLINAPLTILFLSTTEPDRVHDKRLADATPYPLPAGSHLLQDLGFLAFTLDGVTTHTPHKKPLDSGFVPSADTFLAKVSAPLETPSATPCPLPLTISLPAGQVSLSLPLTVTVHTEPFAHVVADFSVKKGVAPADLSAVTALPAINAMRELYHTRITGQANGYGLYTGIFHVLYHPAAQLPGTITINGTAHGHRVGGQIPLTVFPIPAG